MAVKPSDLFPNISLETVETVQGIFIPLSDLPGLTSVEANPTTGDGREVLRIVTVKAASNLATLPTAPVGMSFTSNAPVRNGKQLQEVTLTWEVNIAPESYVLPSQS